MSLLEELVKSKETVNVDPHSHGHTGSGLRKQPKTFGEKFFNLFIEEGFSNLVELFDRMRKTDLDILYLTNFHDLRLEDWTSEEQLQLAKEAGYEIEQGEYYTFAKKDERVVGLGKSQEISTVQGHVLVSGLKRNRAIASGHSLDETLEQVDDNELKIADHSYAWIGKSGTLRRSKNPKQDAEKFDALEKNGNFSFVSMPFSPANYLAKRASKKYQRPLLVGSDAHHPKDIGKTYNIFNSKDLDYRSQREFRDSINYEVRENNFITRFTPIPPWRVFHHVFMLLLFSVMNKLHLVEKYKPEEYSNN